MLQGDENISKTKLGNSHKQLLSQKSHLKIVKDLKKKTPKTKNKKAKVELGKKQKSELTNINPEVPS